MKLLAISHSCVVDVNQQLYVALTRAGVALELVVPAQWNDAYSRGKAPRKAPQILPAANFPVHALPVWKPGHLMLYCYRSGLAKRLDTFRPEVVFLDEEPGSFVAAQCGLLCARRRIPLVLYTKQNIRKSYPPPFNFIENRTYRTARAIVALSPEVREVLRAKGFAGDAPLLAHGCDLALFHAAKNAELRAALGLTKPTIGYLGRLVTEKGLDTLIEAAALLRAKNLEFQVLLVGAGEAENSLRASITNHNLESYFVWTGAVPHQSAGDYLRCMDVFALPSRTKPGWKEQFGRVLIEAMACGVPVAGSSSGYIPDLIGDTGGGLIFREGDAPDCARALETLLRSDDLRHSLGHSGALRVRESYTYEAIGAQLLAILEGLTRATL